MPLTGFITHIPREDGARRTAEPRGNRGGRGESRKGNVKARACMGGSAGESRPAGFGLCGGLRLAVLGPGVIWAREVMARWLRDSGGWQCDSGLVGVHMAVCSGSAGGLQGVNTVAVRSALWLMDAKY